MTSPSTKLVATPAPASLYPGVSQSYMSALQGSNLAGTAANTISQAASGSLPMQTSPQVTAMQNYMKQYQMQGAQNLKEQFGSLGLGSSSPFAAAAGQYEASSAADMGNIMAQYQLQQQQQQVQAAETGLGLEQTAALTTYAPDALVTGPSALSQVMGGVAAAGSMFTGLSAAGGLSGLANLFKLGGGSTASTAMNAAGNLNMLPISYGSVNPNSGQVIYGPTPAPPLQIPTVSAGGTIG